MEYRHLISNPKYCEIWGKSYGNELGRLAQRMPGRVDRTNTLFSIDAQEIHTERWWDIMYGQIVVSYRPDKQDPNQVRLTVGGDRVNHHGNCGTPTANILTIKLLLNSVISVQGEKSRPLTSRISISTHRCQDMSTCNSNWKTSLKISLKNSNSKKRSRRMDRSMLKFVKECMDYHNHEYWRKSC